jgi:large subunit ribosomal protein L10
MAITKDKKKEILEKLDGISKKDSIVFVNFHGLNVGDTSNMRSELRNQDLTYFVTKKTLIKKAFSEASIDGELPELEGELALAYTSDTAETDDTTAPAREIYKFQKTHDGNVSILGGVFENKFLTKAEMEEIALIPSHDTLKGMFVNVVNSPIQGLVMTLKAYADSKEA